LNVSSCPFGTFAGLAFLALATAAETASAGRSPNAARAAAKPLPSSSAMKQRERFSDMSDFPKIRFETERIVAFLLPNSKYRPLPPAEHADIPRAAFGKISRNRKRRLRYRHSTL
jgi:hypothetical protein